MFLPLDILFEYWTEQVTFGLLSVMFRFFTRVFYGGFQALHLILFAVLDAVDKPLAFCMLVHVCSLKSKCVGNFDIMKNNFFIVLIMILHIS